MGVRDGQLQMIFQIFLPSFICNMQYVLKYIVVISCVSALKGLISTYAVLLDRLKALLKWLTICDLNLHMEQHVFYTLRSFPAPLNLPVSFN